MNYRKGYVYTEDGGPILPVTNDEQVKMSAGGTLKDYVEYSTEEKICGRWIDGKPLYRKAFYINTSSPNNVIDANFKPSQFTMINFVGWRRYVGGQLIFPYYNNSATDYMIMYSDEAVGLCTQGNTSLYAISGYYEYTKTTD